MNRRLSMSEMNLNAAEDGDDEEDDTAAAIANKLSADTATVCLIRYLLFY